MNYPQINYPDPDGLDQIEQELYEKMVQEGEIAEKYKKITKIPELPEDYEMKDIGQAVKAAGK